MFEPTPLPKSLARLLRTMHFQYLAFYEIANRKTVRWTIFTVVLPRPVPKTYGSLAAHSPWSRHHRSPRLFFAFFFHCAMVINTDDMNHMLLPFSKTNVCRIGLPIPTQCNLGLARQWCDAARSPLPGPKLLELFHVGRIIRVKPKTLLGTFASIW